MFARIMNSPLMYFSISNSFISFKYFCFSISCEKLYLKIEKWESKEIEAFSFSVLWKESHWFYFKIVTKNIIKSTVIRFWRYYDTFYFPSVYFKKIWNILLLYAYCIIKFAYAIVAETILWHFENDSSWWHQMLEQQFS